MKNMERINELFNELVPISGPAFSVAGEIVRAACRIGYRWYNDGDRLGQGYGRETCNPAARYLIAKCDTKTSYALYDLMHSTAWLSDKKYEEALDGILALVLDYLDAHPELKETENKEDMWDFANPEEDRDDDEDWDDEEDWYD